MIEFSVTPEKAAEFLEACKAKEGKASRSQVDYFTGLKDAVSWILGYDEYPLEDL